MKSMPKPTKADRPKKRKKSQKIKTLDLDLWFSICVRERSDWTCQHCGKRYPPTISEWTGNPGNPALHCSHFVGRANYSVRVDPLNAEAHCYGCHSFFEQNPHEHTEWIKGRLGSLYAVLIEKANNAMIGKQIRHEKQEAAEHYRKQYEIMKEQRERGKVGRIDFIGYI